MANAKGQKTFVEVFKEKKITSAKDKMDFFKDNHGIVKSNSHSHNYSIGDKTVRWGQGTIHSGSGISYAKRSDGTQGNNIYWSEMWVGTSAMSNEALTLELKRLARSQRDLTKKVKEVKEKLAFLKETGVDEFSANEYKAYMTLGVLENKDLSKLDKAKVIADLING